MIVLQSGNYAVQIRDLGLQTFTLILKIKVEHNMNGTMRTRIQTPHGMRYIVQVAMLTYEKIEEFRTFVRSQAGSLFLYTDPDEIIHIVRFMREPQVVKRIHRGILGTATLELEGDA